MKPAFGWFDAILSGVMGYVLLPVMILFAGLFPLLLAFDSLGYLWLLVMSLPAASAMFYVWYAMWSQGMLWIRQPGDGLIHFLRTWHEEM